MLGASRPRFMRAGFETATRSQLEVLGGIVSPSTRFGVRPFCDVPVGGARKARAYPRLVPCSPSGWGSLQASRFPDESPPNARPAPRDATTFRVARTG